MKRLWACNSNTVLCMLNRFFTVNKQIMSDEKEKISVNPLRLDNPSAFS